MRGRQCYACARWQPPAVFPKRLLICGRCMVQSITITSAWFDTAEALSIPPKKVGEFEFRRRLAMDLVRTFVGRIEMPNTRIGFETDDYVIDLCEPFGFRSIAYGFRTTYVDGVKVEAPVDEAIRRHLRRVIRKVFKKIANLGQEDVELLQEENEIGARHALYWYSEIQNMNDLALTHAQFFDDDPVREILGQAIDILSEL